MVPHNLGYFFSKYMNLTRNQFKQIIFLQEYFLYFQQTRNKTNHYYEII